MFDLSASVMWKTLLVIMASLLGFVDVPTVAFVNACKKDELTIMALDKDVEQKCKEEIKQVVLSSLFEKCA